MAIRTFRAHSVAAFVELMQRQALGKVRFSEVHVHHTDRDWDGATKSAIIRKAGEPRV